MSKSISVLVGTVVAGLAVAGFATSASAHHRGCNCGPVAPSTYYKTVHPEKYITRFHDRDVFKHVHRVHHITNVTRIQPILHIHEVTRVHHHTIVETSNAYHHVTEHLPPIQYVDHSVINTYDCHCGY